MCSSKTVAACWTLICFSSGPRSISSANEVCAINKRWKVHASEWSVRRGWNHTRRRGGVRSVKSSCRFLAACVGAGKAGSCFARISGFQSSEANFCLPAGESVASFQWSFLWMYNGTTAGLDLWGFLHLWLSGVGLPGKLTISGNVSALAPCCW